MRHGSELWQEYDERGTRVKNGGLVPEGDTNYYVAGASVMLYRYRNGEVEYLFQHRSQKVSSNPNKWDVSFGGHVNYEEPTLDAAAREGQEEIGAKIDIDKLEFAAKYRIADRFINLFFYEWNDDQWAFHFDDEEVSEVRWVKYSDYEAFSIDAPIKEALREDEIYNLCMKNWEKQIKARYENH